ncbi:MAG: class I SAM-dependent methyltransferase [Leptolyngbya sp. SIO1D8]|nr:class I SAM-dependent methyltransferase [Leptolyngbya sp. SIO1D8]
MNDSSQATVLSGVPRTLLLTTRARVEEHQRPNGIFRDPHIAEWWPSLPWDPELDAMYAPLAQLGWAVRAHLFDQIVQRHLSTYANALVIELGSGLSTRYYRIGQRCPCWIELDLPEVISLRRQFDRESSHHRFLSASALDASWMDEVPKTPPETVLILAEGLLMYFEPAQVQSLIDQLKQHFLGATFVFDAVGNITKGSGGKQLARLGAPLKWFIQNEQDLPAMGLSVVEVRSLIQENCRYPDRIGWFRWLPWLSKLPPFRNACLILETRLKNHSQISTGASSSNDMESGYELIH